MRLFRGNLYQGVLIASGILSLILFGIFLLRELYPEYRIYQDDYIQLEQFRSTYTYSPPPPFHPGIKQIVIEKENKGPVEIDRCISCHVALQFEHFSPTKLSLDINGVIRYDERGFPLKTPNENYVFFKLNEKIEELQDKEILKELKALGKEGEIEKRLQEAKRLSSLKTAYVGDHVYDVTKVLKMHPLMGKEVRPFEFHPIEEFGCIGCHSGNERGLTTEKAHGPVFDGEYEKEFIGDKPQFLEKDFKNDPLFSKVFNDKPSHALLFMTTPLYVGGLIEAKCIQCHRPTDDALTFSRDVVELATKNIIQKPSAIKSAFLEDLEAFLTLKNTLKLLQTQELVAVLFLLREREKTPSLSDKERSALAKNIQFLESFKTKEEAEKKLTKELLALAGDENIKNVIYDLIKNDSFEEREALGDTLLLSLQNEPYNQGSLVAKAKAYNLQKKNAEKAQESFNGFSLDSSTLSSIKNDIDLMTRTYQKGKSLYISQACYACHRINGISRAGVGPELTKEGLKYPWFLKESISWPQADLKTSTMPNMVLDHEELEALTTFLLSQTGKRKTDSDTGYKVTIQEWESGKKNNFEKPISPAHLKDIKYGMTIFAVEGCAACHRLKGFQSNTGLTLEKENASFISLWKEKEWFKKLFPEEIRGSELVSTIESQGKEIDKRISSDVRENSLLEEIEKTHPFLIESFYTPFKYALRAKNHTDPATIKAWEERVRKVLLVYIQEYGLGRLICPKPNWSGVSRSDAWLMEHFRNPSALVPRSIMPAFPFDDTKFFALTEMLKALGIQNTRQIKEIWNHFGFNPELAYQMLCSDCHGPFFQGNGPVSEWIYPIPKNLRNALFLRNLTHERAQESIIHGVKGTPMPPWGEVGAGKESEVKEPVLTKEEVRQLVDWLYSSLPGSTVIPGKEKILKWNYTPENVLKDLRKEDLKKLQQDAENEAQERHGRKIDIQHDLLFAALFYPQNNPLIDTDPLFDVTPYPVSEVDSKRFMIKKKFYTKENLEEGQALFNLNCAVCHGKDADGRGLRAQTMVDAKPRMLTNLNWLETRDDLRLLRSIKFGVPGTSMTPWGDQTSGLQRLQLVMYIRSLSNEGILKSTLNEAAYQTFDSNTLALEEARSALAPSIEKALRNKEEWTNKQSILKASPSLNIEEINIAITEERKEQETGERLKKIDQSLLNLILKNKDKKREFLNTGNALIPMLGESEEFDAYLMLFREIENPLFFKEGELFVQEKESDKALLYQKTLFDGLQRRISDLKKHIYDLSTKTASLEKEERLSELNTRLQQMEKMIQKISFLLKRREKNFQRERQEIIVYNREKKSFQ